MKTIAMSKKMVFIMALAILSYVANAQTGNAKKDSWQVKGIIIKSYSNAEGKTREISRCCFIFSYKDKRFSMRVTPIEAFNQVCINAGKDWKMITENKELSLVKDFPQASQEAGIKELKKLVERKVPTGGYTIVYSIENLQAGNL